MSVRLTVSVRILGLVMCLVAAPAAHAQFGNLMGGGKGALGGGGNSSAMGPDEFIKLAKEADLLMKQSANALVKSLASKEKVAEWEAAIKDANTMSDPKEREARLLKIESDKMTALKQVDFNQKSEELKSKASNEQKAQLANASFNFLLALLKDKDLMTQSSNVISSATSNPAMLAKVPMLKDVAQSLASQAGMAGEIGGKLPALFTAVQLKAPPTKASDKPVAVAGD